MVDENGKMSDKEWSRLRRSVKDDIICHYSKGENCTARVGKKCIALRSTCLTNGKCSFYRDRTTMSEKELDQYYRIAMHDMKRGFFERRGE